MLARAVSRTLGSSALRRAAAPAMSVMATQKRGFMSSIEDYGTHLFKGATADKYLAKQGLPAGLLDDPSWTTSAATADSVAKAIMEWAGDKGASVFTREPAPSLNPTGHALSVGRTDGRRGEGDGKQRSP